METAVFTMIREKYTARTTTGQLYNECSEHFSYTLEDTVRPAGVKVSRETAILGGTKDAPIRYELDVTMSNRFKRDMVTVFKNIKGEKWYTETGNVIFKGVRMHGGNTHENTEGCPLVAKYKLNDDTIQRSMEKELTARVKALKKEGKDVYLDVINLPQNG